jgi:hypothetical protein
MTCLATDIHATAYLTKRVINDVYQHVNRSSTNSLPNTNTNTSTFPDVAAAGAPTLSVLSTDLTLSVWYMAMKPSQCQVSSNPIRTCTDPA